MKPMHMTLTPAVAAKLLERNTLNRPLRQQHVKHLAEAMARGEWRETHQGIAFDTDGNLLDGQHRLVAITMQAPGFKIRMVVTKDVDPEVFAYIDATQLKRNVADSLHVDQRLGPIGTFLYKLIHRRPGAITAAMAKPYVDFIQPGFAALLASCSMHGKYWSASPVQAAAILAAKLYDNDHYPFDMYSALNRNQQKEMTPLLVGFHRSVLNNGMKMDALPMFAKCLYAFNEENAQYSKVMIKNPDIYLDMATAYIVRHVPQAAKDIA